MVENTKRKPKEWFRIRHGEKTILKFKDLDCRKVQWHYMGKGMKQQRCTALRKPNGKIQFGTCPICDKKIKEDKGTWPHDEYYYDVIENGVEKVLCLKKTSQRNLNHEIDALRRFSGGDFDISEIEFIVECPPDPRGRKILSFKAQKGKGGINPSISSEEFHLSDGEKALFQNLGIKNGLELSKLELIQVLKGQNIEEERAKQITDNIILGGKVKIPE